VSLVNFSGFSGISRMTGSRDGGGVGINDFLALLANWGPCP
jgi:hypothetical protein